MSDHKLAEETLPTYVTPERLIATALTNNDTQYAIPPAVRSELGRLMQNRQELYGREIKGVSSTAPLTLAADGHVIDQDFLGFTMESSKPVLLHLFPIQKLNAITSQTEQHVSPEKTATEILEELTKPTN